MGTEAEATDRATFFANGYFRVPSVLSDTALKDLQAGLDSLLDDRLVIDETAILERDFRYAKDETSGRLMLRRISNVWRYNDSVWRLLGHPGVIDLATRLTGEPSLPVAHQLVLKAPGDATIHPWHRDPEARLAGEYTHGDFVTGIYADSSDEQNGCLWVVPGTHARPHPGEQEYRGWSRLDWSEASPVSASAGDVVVHHRALFHASGANATTQLRRTVYLQFLPLALQVQKTTDLAMLEKWSQLVCQSLGDWLAFSGEEWPKSLEWLEQIQQRGLEGWIRDGPLRP